MIKLKIQKIEERTVAPSYAKAGDAGMDLYSAEDLILGAGERRAVRTGIKMEIPDGYVGLIWDRSGMAFNNGIKTMAGVVDSGYRGEVKVVLMNLSKEDFEIKKGYKIAQMIIQKFESPEIEITDSLSDSQRGDNGFGSTGL